MAGKAERLREFIAHLKTIPPDQVPTPIVWDEWQEEAGFTADDVALLSRQSTGHQNRARQAVASGDQETVVFETYQALTLAPFDREFLAEAKDFLASVPENVEGLSELRLRVKAMVGSKNGVSPWVIGMAAGGVLALLALGVTVALWRPWETAPPLLTPPPVEASSRELPFSVESRGVRALVEVQKSTLSVYAEAAVVEIRALITIPQDKITAWAGTLLALDADGKVLGSRALQLRSPADAALEPGEVLEFFQLMNAPDWKDRVASLVFQTTDLLASASVPAQRLVLKVQGVEKLTKGYQLEVAQLQSEWKDRFAARVNDTKLEFRNTGLKTFQSLTIFLEWTASDGEVLKVQVLKPVSANRAALPSGGKLSLDNQAVFESEVFPWGPGEAPVPILRLDTWK